MVFWQSENECSLELHHGKCRLVFGVGLSDSDASPHGLRSYRLLSGLHHKCTPHACAECFIRHKAALVPWLKVDGQLGVWPGGDPDTIEAPVGLQLRPMSPWSLIKGHPAPSKGLLPVAPRHPADVCPTGLCWLMEDGESLQRGVAARGKIPYIYCTHSHKLQKQANTCTRRHRHTHAYTHKYWMHNSSVWRCAAWYPAPAHTPPFPPPGEVWQSHAKWILQRKRFKAFMVLSVFQAAASQGFDGLFSRFISGFFRESRLQRLSECVGTQDSSFVFKV